MKEVKASVMYDNVNKLSEQFSDIDESIELLDDSRVVKERTSKPLRPEVKKIIEAEGFTIIPAEVVVRTVESETSKKGSLDLYFARFKRLGKEVLASFSVKATVDTKETDKWGRTIKRGDALQYENLCVLFDYTGELFLLYKTEITTDRDGVVHENGVFSFGAVDSSGTVPYLMHMTVLIKGEGSKTALIWFCKSYGIKIL